MDNIEEGGGWCSGAMRVDTINTDLNDGFFPMAKNKKIERKLT